MTSTPVAGELRVERHQPPSRATVGEWPLEPESAAWAEVLGRVLTAPLRELGVTKARALPVGADPAPQIEVESVYEVTVPIQTGSVPARVYRPTDDAGLPVLLYMHGGGWTVGGPDGTDRLCRQLSQYAQCVVVSLDYPLAPENPFPTAVEACYDALTWVAGGPEELRIDPMRIAVGGDSAGGNLAAALALMARDRGGPTLQAQLLVYPAVDQDTTRTSWTRWAHTPLLDTADVEWFWKLYGAPSDPRDVRAFPGNAESFAELPPTLIVLAEVDPTHDSGMEYGRRLHAAGIDTRVISYGGVFHGFFPRTSLSPSAQNAAERAGEHLRATLHPAPVR
ncbi:MULTISPECIES: alpha/beta hydrolase [Mycobacteriales]|jgi:acetyl esterase|uniref:Alpha/beta hydrolase fold domain-containing protein n=1 Tax=Rhodococcus baikonurensis TaxID=172041 RepID=A0ABV5XNH9_9NOCA|nr:alpha/beta hydrolase [Gordonia polyisoprenivorans]